MSDEKSNLEDREEEDIFDETETSNESEGDGTKDNVSAEDEALRVYNERTGKTFKSWDDVQKSTKEADKLFAKGTHKKEIKDRPSYTPSYLEEEILTIKHPDAEYILDEIKEESVRQGIPPLEVFRKSKYLQGEAKARSEAKKFESEQKSKVGTPSGGTHSIRDYSKISPKDALNLSDEEYEKWSKANE